MVSFSYVFFPNVPVKYCREALFSVQFAMPGARSRARAHGSNASENEKNDDDDKYQPQAACRGIAPVPAVRPAWQRTHQRQNQDHDQYGSKHVLLLFRASFGYRRFGILLMVNTAQ